jgi:4-amino-4-deoxy-L-arabinose transferase-like glycosyltransferase
MNRQKLIQNPFFFLLLAYVLFFPAFMINLGDQPIIEDEAIRSLVAFEMHKSGDYITPTIGGVPYLRKPPLYNWLIAGSYSLFGNYSEQAVRFPMVIALLLFSFTLFLVIRKQLGNRMGIINALIFLTLGRILFYESLHGLIDIAFSWLTYLFFMLSYIFFKKEKFLLLFVVAYLITSVTWMMKGLPSLVFLAITLLALFIQQRRFRMLFNWRHFVGMAIFLVLVGSYYLVYFSMNDISPKELFMTLLGQTTRRTVVRFGWLVTLQHLFIFPFDMLYHFLPWTLLTLVLFVKGGIRKIWAQPFLRYNILLLVLNIIPYWTSPEVHPRYILMLAPLYFTSLTWLYFEIRESRRLLPRITEYIFGGLMVIACVAPCGALFHDMTRGLDHVLITAIILSLALVVICVLYWKEAGMRLFWLAIAMLVIRIGFDFLVLPTRQMDSDEVVSKQSAIELAEKTKGKALYSYWNPKFEPSFYYMKNFIAFRYHFHLAAARDGIVYNISERIPGALYFSSPDHFDTSEVIVIDTVIQHLDDTSPLPLFTFLPTPE